MCVCVCFFLWPVSSIPRPSSTSPYARLSSCALTVPFVSFDSPLLSSFSHHSATVDTINLIKRIAHWWDCWAIYGEENKNHQNHNSTFVNILEFIKHTHVCHWLSQNKQTYRGGTIITSKESTSNLFKATLLIKSRAWTWTRTSSFSYTALFPCHWEEIS